jgi:GNAT superfamily N-acetyltransferase
MPDRPIVEYRRDPFCISTDPTRLDLDVIHGFLTHSYWSPGIPREVIAAALQASLCFGLYHGDAQVGLARVLTDYATFAYLCDVFVLKSHRGHGLGVWLMECVTATLAPTGIRTFLLATRDAHDLYRKVGFEPLPNTERWMMIRYPMTRQRPEMVIE